MYPQCSNQIGQYAIVMPPIVRYWKHVSQQKISKWWPFSRWSPNIVWTRDFAFKNGSEVRILAGMELSTIDEGNQLLLVLMTDEIIKSHSLLWH